MILILLLCGVSLLDATGAAPCPSGWSVNGTSCYYVSSVVKNWHQAQNACIADGANLVIVDTPEENAFVASLLVHRNHPYWTAGNDVENEADWFWENGNGDYRMEYTNWHRNEPNTFHGHNEDCVEMYDYGKWNDTPCKNHDYYICEKTAINSILG